MQLDLYFLQPIGLWTLLALIPLLLLYLLRPKPKQQTIPSLMFLLRDKGKPLHKSFFRKLFNDLLLLFHFLLFLGLAAAVAEPFISVPKAELQSHTVIVLDNSASMYAEDGLGIRYEQARDIALSKLSSENTVILAGERAHIALEEVSAARAQAYLRTWKPSHEATKLGTAILAAQNVELKKSRVIVISDFADTDTTVAYQNAIKTVQSLGVPVVLEQVGQTAENIGIVDVHVTEEKTTVFVKNYFNQAKVVQICAQDTCTDLALSSQGIESWSFATPAGATEVVLDIEDGLAIDNVAYVSTPKTRIIKTLLVTNGVYEDTALWHAFNAITASTPLTIEVDVSVPPDLATVDHDLIVYMEVDPKLFVSRVARDTLSAVRAGNAAVIIDQEAIGTIDYGGLLPLQYGQDGGSTAVQNTESLRAFVGMDFGSVTNYHSATTEATKRVIAQVPDETPVISLFPIGAGNVLYFGLPEKTASFPLSPEYPLFWKRMIDLLNSRDRPEQLNAKSGAVFAAEYVLAPDKNKERSPAIANVVGLWQVDDRSVAINLANAKESDLAVPSLLENGEAKNTFLEEAKQPKTYTFFVLIGLLALVLLEVIFLKWRGDL